jgi:hypothetical protein
MYVFKEIDVALSMRDASGLFVFVECVHCGEREIVFQGETNLLADGLPMVDPRMRGSMYDAM